MKRSKKKSILLEQKKSLEERMQELKEKAKDNTKRKEVAQELFSVSVEVRDALLDIGSVGVSAGLIQHGEAVRLDVAIAELANFISLFARAGFQED